MENMVTLESVIHLSYFAFDMADPNSATDLASFFSDALDWGISAAKGYLAFSAAVALAVYFFKG